MGKNTLKGVWVFLALVWQVVAPAALSSGQVTLQVMEEPTNRVLNEYDVFMIQILMSRSLTSLEQDVPQSWSNIPRYGEASSSLLTLQRKLDEHDVLQTLIVLDTLPELVNDDLVQKAVLKTWTTLEDEEELLETHFGKKTSRNKHVVLTNGSFQSLLSQLKGEPSESDEVHTPLHSADSPSKLVIMDGVPQLLRFQELQILFGAYVQHTLLNQQELMKRKLQLPRRANAQSGSHGTDIRKEVATKSKVVLTKDAFQSLLKQFKLDTLQDEDNEPSHSQDVEVSASKVGVSKGRTTSPLMLQREFLSKLVSQTMNTLYRQSALQDQLKFLDGALDQDLPESLEDTESPSKLVTPLMYQKEFLSKILSLTRNTIYGDLGFLDQVELWDGVLALAFQEHLAKTGLPNKLSTPIMYQREFIGKILLQTMSTIYGESGLEDELNFLDQVLDQDLPESIEETESPSKLITPVMHQREFLSKDLLLTMSTLYGESGLQDQLKVFDEEDLTSMEHPDNTESLSKYNTLVMHQREFLSKILSQTMNTLYGDSGLQDQLKFLDGEDLTSMEHPDKTESPSKLITPVMHQREFLSKELLLTMSKLYGESGLQEKLRAFNGILDLALLDHPGKTESPSKFITPVMYERESLIKELLQTMSTLYRESGLQDQLKFLDGEDLASLERPDKTESPSKLISPVMYQREFLSKILSQTMNTLYGDSGLQDQLKIWDGVMDQTKYTRLLFKSLKFKYFP